MKVPPQFAALANGTSIHADDYDDTGSSLHVAAPALPPAFALCETGRRSGQDRMLAFHVGVEVESKIRDAMPPRHDGDGFHTTGTIGAFGTRPRAPGCSGSTHSKRRTRSAWRRRRRAGFAATTDR